MDVSANEFVMKKEEKNSVIDYLPEYSNFLKSPRMRIDTEKSKKLELTVLIDVNFNYFHT